MHDIATVIELDMAKLVFVAVGMNDRGKVLWKKKLARSEVLPFFATLTLRAQWISRVRKIADTLSESAAVSFDGVSYLRQVFGSDRHLEAHTCFPSHCCHIVSLGLERITDRQMAFDHLPILHVFRVQDRATGHQRRGDD